MAIIDDTGSFVIKPKSYSKEGNISVENLKELFCIKVRQFAKKKGPLLHFEKNISSIF